MEIKIMSTENEPVANAAGQDVTANADASNEVVNNTDDGTATQVELTAEEKLQKLEEEYAKLKSNSRKWEDRAKADEEPAKKYREWVKSQKPEQERLEEELNAYKAELAELKVEKLKTSIIVKKGLPANEEILKLLNGKTTEEELEAAADAILLLIKNENTPKTPKPVAEQGKAVSGTATTAQMFANAIGGALNN